LTDQIEVHPLTPSRWPDLESLFATHREPHSCWCMFWRSSEREFKGWSHDQRKGLLRARVDAGQVPGLLAYADGQPVGWCGLGPRAEFPMLQRSPTLKPVDALPVWSTVCFFVHPKHRRRGVASALLRGAVDFVRAQGAPALEGYPRLPKTPRIDAAYAYPGTLRLFESASFEELLRRSPGRAIVRYRFGDRPGTEPDPIHSPG
jgi:GNAT superfamily N-acetyltransferase